MKHCAVISDFNIQPLADYLRNDASTPQCSVDVSPFGQVTQTLLDFADKPVYDTLIIWTRPEAVITGYAALIDQEDVDDSAVLGEVGGFAQLILNVARTARHVVVPTWSRPHYRRGLGVASMRPNGAALTLMKMNVELCRRLAGQSNVYVLNSNAWITMAGPAAFSPQLWYLAKVPFSSAVFETAAHDIKAALRAAEGQVVKAILLDLDDTLWGGIVGEIGWEKLRIGGHDAVGEAFRDFQKQLKALTRIGIILGIASKNDEHTALQAIDEHPEMILKRSDFAAWRINWSDKAQNITEIAAELNVDLSSIVYIDDSPIERNRIRTALPAVIVPEWPADPLEYPKRLAELTYFDKATITSEDRSRAGMYTVERTRAESKQNFLSIQDWLQSLEMKVAVESLSTASVARAAQLFNKTNQMNLSTRRLSEAELLQWSNAPGHRITVFRISDKFGDYGLSGIIGLASSGPCAKLTDFLLSCRAMGRGLEDLMLHIAVESAKSAGATHVRADYLPTARNRPCLEFFRNRSRFQADSDFSFIWQTQQQYPAPEHIVWLV